MFDYQTLSFERVGGVFPVPSPPVDEDPVLAQLQAEFGATHRVWRSKGGGGQAGGWYATLRRNPRPEEEGRLFLTVGADTSQGLRELLEEQSELAERPQGVRAVRPGSDGLS